MIAVLLGLVLSGGHVPGLVPCAASMWRSGNWNQHMPCALDAENDLKKAKLRGMPLLSDGAKTRGKSLCVTFGLTLLILRWILAACLMPGDLEKTVGPTQEISAFLPVRLLWSQHGRN